MSLTAHEAFETELILAHGRICTDNDDDLCKLLDAWSTVTDEYDRLLAAARAVVASATGLLDCDTICGQCRHVPTALIDRLRVAVEQSRV